MSTKQRESLAGRISFECFTASMPCALWCNTLAVRLSGTLEAAMLPNAEKVAAKLEGF
ncbi:MAG: hypothetical protein R3B47_13030 [Bacteroidia bacterium]